MRKIIWVLGAISFSNVAAAQEAEFVGIKPTAIFAKESTHVTVSAKWKNPVAENERVFLLETDEKGTPLKIIGEMNDTGRWGDTLAGDGYFSKQFQVYEKRGDQRRYYAAIRRRSGEDPMASTALEMNAVPTSGLVSVEVLRRPNVFEILSKVWAKLTR